LIMAQPDSQEADTVSLEELLQIKRWERPDADYWERFERELHAKPWQGMVQKRSLSDYFRIKIGWIGLLSVPVGVAAALIFSLNGVRFIADGSPGGVEISRGEISSIVANGLVTAPPQTEVVEPPPEPSVEGKPHFVVGSFSTGGTGSGVYTTVAATHYMPATQRDGVHFAQNIIAAGGRHFGEGRIQDLGVLTLPSN